eukprot:6475038-Amphidinium_carterae.1
MKFSEVVFKSEMHLHQTVPGFNPQAPHYPFRDLFAFGVWVTLRECLENFATEAWASDRKRC